MKKGRCGLDGGRVTWTLLAIDLNESIVGIFHRVALQGRGEHIAHIIAVGEKYGELSNTGLDQSVDHASRHFGIGFQDDLARSGIHHFGPAKSSFQILNTNLHPFDFCFLELSKSSLSDLSACRNQNGSRFARGRDLFAQLVSDQILIQLPEQLSTFDGDGGKLVESLQELFVGAQTQCTQEDSGQKLPLPIDANVEQILIVVFKLHPRTPVGNDLGQEVTLLGC